jgi:hypothetical protein
VKNYLLRNVKPAVPRIDPPKPPVAVKAEIGPPAPRGTTVDAMLGAVRTYQEGSASPTAGGPSDCADLWATPAAADDPKPARDAGEGD